MSDIIEKMKAIGLLKTPEKILEQEAKITALRAEVNRLRAMYEPPGEPDARQEAEHLGGQIKELLAENEKLYTAALKADRYLALNSPSLARETLTAAIAQPALQKKK